MANRYYEKGQERAAKVQNLFSTIAARYDLINDLQSFGLHRYWKRRLIRMAHVSSSDRVLDLCCGTGDLALQFRAKCRTVVGLDFNGPMLAMARARAEAPLLNVHWVQGDALNLPFKDGLFDIVSVSYGLRNLADLELGMREMWRVARPGGRLLILDFGKPAWLPFRKAYFAYLRHWVPLFGRLFCRDSAAYSYILESLEHYPAQEGVAHLMAGLPCRSVQVANLLGGIMSIHYGEKAT